MKCPCCGHLFRRRWLTISEAAEAVGVTPRTISNWIAEGLLSYLVTPTGHRRVDCAALVRTVPAHQTTTAIIATQGKENGHDAETV